MRARGKCLTLPSLISRELQHEMARRTRRDHERNEHSDVDDEGAKKGFTIDGYIKYTSTVFFHRM